MTNLMKRGNFYGYPTSYRTAHCVISHDGLWFCSCKDKNCKLKRQQNPVPYQCLSDYALRYYKYIPDWLFKRNSRWIFTGTFCRCYHSSSIVSYLRNPWKIFKFNFRRKSIFDLFQCRLLLPFSEANGSSIQADLCVSRPCFCGHMHSPLCREKQNLTGKRFCRMWT